MLPSVYCRAHPGLFPGQSQHQNHHCVGTIAVRCASHILLSPACICEDVVPVRAVRFALPSAIGSACHFTRRIYCLFRYDDDDTDLVKDGRVVLLSNPATFRVNGVTVALTSTDVVADTMTEQIARSGPHKVNRFQRVLQHILSQRNMYPVFPANRRVPLDCGRLKAVCTFAWGMRDSRVSTWCGRLAYLPICIDQARFADGGKTAPDILLLRSKLTYFIQNVFGTVCVNSGPLSKGSAGGSSQHSSHCRCQCLLGTQCRWYGQGCSHASKFSHRASVIPKMLHHNQMK